MKDARKEIKALCAKMLRSRTRLLFLDFDGTLAPIVEHPSKARMPREVRGVLRKCLKCFTVVIVSGRALADVKRRVGLHGAIYAGNHGLEWEMRGIQRSVKIPARARRGLLRAGVVMRSFVQLYRGIVIEEKGFSVTLNYRGVARGERSRLVRQVLQALSSETDSVTIRHDAKTIECVPSIPWHKGALVRHMRAQFAGRGSVGAIYIGDALTDEDAFRALPRMSVRVGKSRTSRAAYFVPTQKDVVGFLKQLSAIERC